MVRIQVHVELQHGLPKRLSGITVQAGSGVILGQNAAHSLAAKGSAQKLAGLLVDKGHHLDGALRDIAGLMKGGQKLQRRHHAGHAVEPSSVGDGIKMGAGEDGGQILFSLHTAQNISHPVHTDGEAGFLHPAHKDLTCLPVLRGPGKPADSPLGIGSHAPQGLQPGPQTFTIDSHFPSPPAVFDGTNLPYPLSALIRPFSHTGVPRTSVAVTFARMLRPS